MSCKRNKFLTTDCLMAFIDIKNIKSWDLNELLKVKSITKWHDAHVCEENLKDFGLTYYDNGFFNEMTGNTLNITPYNNKFQMQPVGENNASGQTSYENYQISGITTDNIIGNYFETKGGYLQGYFKLHDYEYEILPYRYKHGLTIDMWVEITQNTYNIVTGNTDGFFFYMGTRAENKYSIGVCEEKKLRTSENDDLMDDHPTNLIKNIENNVIAFRINQCQKLEYRYLDEESCPIIGESENILTTTGWTMLTITYEPYEKFDDDDLLECYPRRFGDLKFYVNSRLFWVVENFREFWFYSLDTQRTKQIGVPYNISWGGGSFGLKHSWHFKDSDDLFLSKKFIEGGNEILKNQIFSPYTMQHYTQFNDSLLLKHHYWSSIFNGCILVDTYHPITTNHLMILETKDEICIDTNNEYLFSIDLDPKNLFFSGITTENPTISWDITGLTDYIILEESKYEYQTHGQNNNVFTTIMLRIKTFSNIGCVCQKIKPKLMLNSTMGLFSTNDIEIFVKNLEINEYCYKFEVNPRYKQDIRKQNLTIQKYFDGSFYGGLQQLRLYCKPLNFQQIKNNYEFDMENRYNTMTNKCNSNRIIKI